MSIQHFPTTIEKLKEYFKGQYRNIESILKEKREKRGEKRKNKRRKERAEKLSQARIELASDPCQGSILTNILLGLYIFSIYFFPKLFLSKILLNIPFFSSFFEQCSCTNYVLLNITKYFHVFSQICFIIFLMIMLDLSF